MRTDVQPFHSRPFTRSVTLSFIALAPSEGSPAQSGMRNGITPDNVRVTRRVIKPGRRQHQRG
ncbi:hypothetical protein [Escherichia coli ISC7]|uniref:Uncharacterized protein n=1 Tax=Escherichia coli ISC7 TaxID=1432555 RepID=W1EWV8_ECOLX|nr:hypothetical protein [Escherichia coli ISC7]